MGNILGRAKNTDVERGCVERGCADRGCADRGCADRGCADRGCAYDAVVDLDEVVILGGDKPTVNDASHNSRCYEVLASGVDYIDNLGKDYKVYDTVSTLHCCVEVMRCIDSLTT
jgi:hypothetical protein